MRAIALAYLPVILILPAIMQDPTATIKLPYVLIFLILLLYTLPFYVVYLGIYSLTSFLLDKKQISGFRKTLKIIGAILLSGTVISVIFIDKAPAVCFVFAGALALTMILETVANAGHGDAFTLFKDKWAWVIALVITVLLSGIFLAIDRSENGKNKPDPEAPSVCIGVPLYK